MRGGGLRFSLERSLRIKLPKDLGRFRNPGLKKTKHYST